MYDNFQVLFPYNGMNEQIKWALYFAKSKFSILLNRFRLSRFTLSYYSSKVILDRLETNKTIYKWISEGTPKMIARYGSNECHTTVEAIGVKLGVKRHISPKMLININRNAGVFPYGQETACRFGKVMQQSSKEVDLLGYWETPMQDYLINNCCKADLLLTKLMNLEPYYENDLPWTKALSRKKVLVIHPFEHTIRNQYKKRKLLFNNQDILPEFELSTVKAVQTVAGESDNRFCDWFEALDFMYDEAMKSDFDVAILGCGAYGFPLAAKLKKSGKIAIHLGGATQILFGIKGARWDNHPIISNLYNEHWVRPSAEERPQKADAVENGCYW